MASKKREIRLQAVINNQRLWDEMLQNKGLTVIDVYQAWCGPCKAMQTLFRKLKNEVNEDEILHFAVAEADSIVTLQPFRDKCEPVFLFSVDGKIIAKIKGANAPLVNQKIISLINEEKKIAAGEMDRPQYQEIAFVDSDTEDAGEAPYENVEPLYIIAIIKPDAVISRKALEIKEKIVEAGFVIEAEDKRVLTDEQVRGFYIRIADQPDFEDFVLFMTSGLSYVLVISQGDTQQLPWKETKPNSEAESKEPPEDENEMATATQMKKQDSLQEYLERQHISQFCDVEENIANVNKLIDIFFPDFKNMKGIKLEKILALLRPDLFHERKEHVLNIIQEEGFKILMQRQIVLTEGEAQTLCKEYENEDYFEDVIENMTCGPSLALVLLRENGLQHWKELMGPNNVEKAKEYLPEWSGLLMTGGPVPCQPEYGHNFAEEGCGVLGLELGKEILRLIKENGFDITQMKEMLLTEEHADKIYPRIKGRDFYKNILEMLSEGPSMVMILTKWNAVSEWRRLMGPTDPDEAKLLSPDSIRAQFGRSVLKNAVHGSSNINEAVEVVNSVFEDMDPENPED
ncbi:hypothetical protein MC885_012520 [Smutsia gigantea]|nr:hypothetical protein MC885_012520 [Smutsia gigantea]